MPKDYKVSMEYRVQKVMKASLDTMACQEPKEREGQMDQQDPEGNLDPQALTAYLGRWDPRAPPP